MNRYKIIAVIVALLVAGWSSQASAQLADPTKPPDPGARLGAYVLSEIVIAGDHRVAVVNGKILHVGEKIDNATLTAIHENQVEIEDASGKQTLIFQDFYGKGPLKRVKE